MRHTDPIVFLHLDSQAAETGRFHLVISVHFFYRFVDDFACVFNTTHVTLRMIYVCAVQMCMRVSACLIFSITYKFLFSLPSLCSQAYTLIGAHGRERIFTLTCVCVCVYFSTFFLVFIKNNREWDIADSMCGRHRRLRCEHTHSQTFYIYFFFSSYFLYPGYMDAYTTPII